MPTTESQLKASKKWREANKEKYKACINAWREKNREHYNTIQLGYMQKHLQRKKTFQQEFKRLCQISV